jgi:hypothetical protein
MKLCFRQVPVSLHDKLIFEIIYLILVSHNLKLNHSLTFLVHSQAIPNLTDIYSVLSLLHRKHNECRNLKQNIKLLVNIMHVMVFHYKNGC